MDAVAAHHTVLEASRTVDVNIVVRPDTLGLHNQSVGRAVGAPDALFLGSC